MTRFLSHHPRNRYKLLFFIVALLLFAALVLTILEKTKTTDLIKMPVSLEEKQAREDAETAAKNNETQRKTDEQQKQEFLDNAIEEQAIDSPAPETAPLISEVKAKQENENVVVLTKLASVASGSCTLRITNGTTTHEQQAQVIYQPEFSSCAGFSVQKSALSSGIWNITLEATSGSVTSTKTIEFEVK